MPRPNQKNIRDGSSPRDLSSEDESKRAPSAREIRHLARDQYRSGVTEARACVDKVPTVNANRSAPSSNTRNQCEQERKDSNNVLMPKPRHRKSYPPDSLPDRLCHGIEDYTNQVLTYQKLGKLSIHDHSKKLLNSYYAYFKQHCGVVEPTSDNGKSVRAPRKHKGLESLRARKQQAKKAWKTMKGAGLTDSPEGKLMYHNWKQLLKEHNRLRVAVRKRAQQRQKRAGEKAFRKDPRRFADKLFNGKSGSATPTFTKEDAVKYFCKTYRDEERNHQYSPLPDMIRPGLPKTEFITRCPTLAEMKRSARRKRNGARAGLDEITNVCWKKCPAMLRALHKLGCRILKKCTTAEDCTGVVPGFHCAPQEG